MSLFLLIFYLLILCSFALRGALPYQLKQKSCIAEQSARTTSAGSSSRSVALNIQMDELMKKRTILSEEIEPLQDSDSSTNSPQQGNKPEMTRWKTSEILKVNDCL